MISEVETYKLVLNMENVTFVDSMGLGSIISILKTAKNHNGDLKLASTSKTVRAIIEIIRLHKIVQIFANPEQAVKSFKEKEDGNE